MDPTTDQLFLLNNIKSLDGKDIVPSELSIDTTCFPIFTSQQGKLVAAGTFLDKGKLVAIGHEGLINRDGGDDDSPQFIQNIVRWLAPGKATPSIGMLMPGYNGFRNNMTTAGCSVADVPTDQLSLQTVDAVCADTYTKFNDNQLSEIRTYVSGGGGLLVGGHNWYYKRDWANNILLGSGIIVTDVQSDGYQVFTPIHPSPSTSVARIIQGVSEPNLDGLTPGTLSLFENNAFGLVDRDRNIIIAGAHCELGRMIHFGHEGIVNIRRTTDDAMRLVQNSSGWLTRLKQGISVGFLVTSEGLKTSLLELGHTVHNINVDDDLSPYSLLFTTTYQQYTEGQLQKIHTFVATGGGLLTGGHNWSGVKAYGDILMPGGMFLTNGYTSGGIMPVISRTPESQDLLNAFNCIKSLISHVKKELSLSLDDQKDIAATILSASVTLPSTVDEFWRAGEEFLQLLQPLPINSSLDTKAQPVEASYVYIFNSIVETEDVDNMKSYPEAKVFPGEIPSTLQPLSKSVEVDATFSGLPDYFPSSSNPVWRSTGLYAAPCVPITVTVPPEAMNKGLHVLIGCHVDDLTRKDTLHRYPRITRSFEILSSVTKAANVFGGLIYITVPVGVDLGKLQVSIDNGYAVPEFVLGKTDDANWKKSLSDNPVPFCELISDNIILTIQTSEATNRVKSPTELMKIYRACVEVTNELSGINYRARGERFVLDIQISAGYMYAGYPIMGPISASESMLDIDVIHKDNIWGPVHEIGHQYQTRGWTPTGGGEATNNIFSVYASERVLNIPRNEAHGSLSPTERQQRIEKYIEDGRKYEDWTVWTCLETYLQLQTAFGWDFFVKTLGEYNQDMPQRPSSNQEILDEWMRRSSRITGYNLGPFYEGWGWPVSQQALQDIANLPHWIKNPMPPN